MLVEENGLTSFSEGDSVSSARSVLAALDDSGLSGFHWKTMITAGMGFFYRRLRSVHYWCGISHS